jgi:hypothetical protein
MGKHRSHTTVGRQERDNPSHSCHPTVVNSRCYSASMSWRTLAEEKCGIRQLLDEKWRKACRARAVRGERDPYSTSLITAWQYVISS